MESFELIFDPTCGLCVRFLFVTINRFANVHNEEPIVQSSNFNWGKKSCNFHLDFIFSAGFFNELFPIFLLLKKSQYMLHFLKINMV